MDAMSRTRLAIPAILIVAAVSATALFVIGGSTTSGASAIRGSIDSDVFGRTQDMTGEELRNALEIPTLTWAFDERGAIVLSAPEGYERLESCGEDLAALRVVHGGGTAYCIPGASSTPEKGFEAASAILRITQDRIPSDIELQILRVESELAFVDPESAEHGELLTDLLDLQDSLSSGEMTTIQEAYDRLAVGSR